MDNNTKLSLATLGTVAVFAVVQLTQSCSSGQPPTRTQVEAAEDKFCAGIAKLRAVEKALDSGAQNDSAGGPQ